jgi:hypothetical protein
MREWETAEGSSEAQALFVALWALTQASKDSTASGRSGSYSIILEFSASPWQTSAAP